MNSKAMHPRPLYSTESKYENVFVSLCKERNVNCAFQTNDLQDYKDNIRYAFHHIDMLNDMIEYIESRQRETALKNQSLISEIEKLQATIYAGKTYGYVNVEESNKIYFQEEKLRELEKENVEAHERCQELKDDIRTLKTAHEKEIETEREKYQKLKEDYEALHNEYTDFCIDSSVEKQNYRHAISYLKMELDQNTGHRSLSPDEASPHSPENMPSLFESVFTHFTPFDGVKSRDASSPDADNASPRSSEARYNNLLTYYPPSDDGVPRRTSSITSESGVQMKLPEKDLNTVPLKRLESRVRYSQHEINEIIDNYKETTNQFLKPKKSLFK
jgi:chemotaxis protein histidine kinase CheA